MRQDYKSMNRPFHGEYMQTEPGQGKRPEQYEYSMTLVPILFAIIFGIVFFVGIWTAIEWLWNLLTSV